jgi:hypothetical protein
MRNRSNKFFLREPVFKSLLEMEFDLFDTIQRNQAGNRDQALIALRESGTFPNITEKKILGKLRKFRRYSL